MKLASFIQSVALLAAVAATPSCSKSEIGADDARLEPVKSPCPTTGSPMVKLTTPSGWSFCIDKTAVKQKDYEVWVKATDGRSKRLSNGQYADPQSVTCESPVSLPGFDWHEGHSTTGCTPVTYSPEERPDAPVVCVGVCQARAYCKFVGKRLCARIGGGVLSQPKDFTIEGSELADGPDMSELYYACSQGGKTRFAWGDTKPAPAERCGVEGCAGEASPFDQILGMSDGPGVPEERCFEGNPALCLTRSAYGNGIDPERRDGACDVAVNRSAGPETGIRCCADPL